MSKKIFFSKPLEDINDIKSNFFKDNNKLLKQALMWNKIYSRQKKRTKCINCHSKLHSFDFVSHNVKYVFCKKCNHFNGFNEETDHFYKLMYINKKGGKFSKFYTSDYKARIKKIYHPKLTFVKNIIPKIHSLLDLGCGAGHFVKACEEKSIKATGYDVNKTSIDYGKKLLTKNKIFSFNQEDIFLKIKNSKDTVITMFGVIEHLQKPYKIFSSFNESKAKYLVISVPTFSLTVLMEHVFQNVYPRQLGGVHTHLYTNQSLNYIFNKFKLRIVGEWWFGTDLMDFKRSIISSDQKNKKFSKIVNNYFKDITDEMQNSIDKKKISSEAHIILKKK